LPCEPFHSIFRCFLKRVIGIIANGFTFKEIKEIDLKLKEIKFPKGMKKVKTIR
jgi:hypothetical protein